MKISNAMLRLMGGMGLALVLAGCVSTRNGVPLPSNAAAKETPVVTESDETNDRKRAKLRVELAVSYYEQGQTTVALDQVKLALAADPTFADAYNLRGLIYMRMNELALAEDGFRRAVALNPRDAYSQHNYGWLLCQQKRYAESDKFFEQAEASPTYTNKAKTLMAHGLCQMNAGKMAEAERTLTRSYELDAGNPVTGYNLAQMLFKRGDLTKAQFYIRRLNNSEYANAESLWLGIKVERQINDRVAMAQLGEQLKRRFPASNELTAYEKGAFNE